MDSTKIRLASAVLYLVAFFVSTLLNLVLLGIFISNVLQSGALAESWLLNLAIGLALLANTWLLAAHCLPRARPIFERLVR